MSRQISRTKLLKWLLVEEWRTHTTLFGKTRFLMFPLIILLFSTVISAAIPILTTNGRISLLIINSFMIVFGFQTGTVGFDAQDALDHVLGERTTVLYSSRILPVSQKRLASLFMLKDAIYYTALAIIPIFVGSLLGSFITPFGTVIQSISIIDISILYISMTLSFLFGVASGFASTTISPTKNPITSSLVILLVIGSLLVARILAIGLIELIDQPLAIFSLLIIGTILSTVIGLYNFQGTKRGLDKSYPNRYRSIRSFVRSLNSSLVSVATRTILDIKRTGGGLSKLVFVSAIIGMSGIGMAGVVAALYPIYPRIGILFGCLTSLITYPIYAMIFRYDSISEYKYLPIPEEKVWKSKIGLAILITIPLSVGYITPAIIAVDISNSSLVGSIPLSLLNSIVVTTALIVYQVGLLVHLVEDKPIKFLFNGVLFSKFSVSVFVFLIPLITVGQFGTIISEQIVRLTVAYSILSGIIGVALLRRR